MAAPAGNEPVERWRYVDPEAGHDQVTGEADETLFAGSSLPGCAYGFSGFAALDAETGDPIWQVTPDDLLGDVSSTIEQYDDRILFPLYSPEGPSLVALDAETGEEVWTVPGETGTPLPMGTTGDRLLTLESGNETGLLAALDLESGEPAWSVGLEGYTPGALATEDAVYVSLRSGELGAFEWETLALDPESGDGTETLTVSDLETGDNLWTADPIEGGLGRLLTVSDETDLAYLAVDFGASGAVSALDLDDGDLAWDVVYDDLGGPPILRVTDETLYLSASSEEETVLIALEPAGS